MTTVVVLGGAGAMAQPVLTVLARNETVGELVVADLRAEAAREAAAKLGPNARAVAVDVTDAAALRALLQTADLVVNTAGPFFRLAIPVLQAAIETQTDYIDICDDWEPIEEMFDHDPAAAAAGISAIVGMGASPGLSNLLAALAVSKLDTVTDLYTAWPVDIDMDGQSITADDDEDVELGAAAVHWMQQISGSITAVRNGQLAASHPLSAVTLDYPSRGRGTAYVVGHPEPIMFRRTFEPTGESSNLMVATDGTIAFLDGLRKDIDAGKMSLESAASELDHPSPGRIARAGLKSLRLAGPGKLPGFFALVRGTLDGRPASAAARLLNGPAGMAGVTGIPLAIAAEMMLSGTVTRHGVLAPEQVIDPVAMFAALAPHCAVPVDSWTDVVAVDVAPDPS
jgi:lysine 6-dehydrogenase